MQPFESNFYGDTVPMDDKLTVIRKLSKECPTGLLISYKALKKFDFNYEKALHFLREKPIFIRTKNTNAQGSAHGGQAPDKED